VSTEDQHPRRGLADSIDRLFEGLEHGPDARRAKKPEGSDGASQARADLPPSMTAVAAPEVRRPPSNALPASPQPSNVDALAVELEQAVQDYLWASDPAAGELTERIETLGKRLAASEELHPVLAAIERLASSGTRQQAALLLAQKLLTPKVALGLAVMLGAASRDAPRREQLTKVTVKLGGGMVQALADALMESTDRGARRAYIDALSALGAVALPAVREMVRDPRWFVVRNAILLLRDIGGADEMEHFTAALSHHDAQVRREAVVALAQVGGGDTAAKLVSRKISDPSPDVRRSAAVAAGALKSGQAVLPMIAQLDRESMPDVIEVIMLALGQIGDPLAVPALEKRAAAGFFARPHSSVRIAALRALDQIGTPQAKKRVKDAAGDRDPVVRHAVEQLLKAR
jgi:hypothetical protein